MLQEPPLHFDWIFLREVPKYCLLLSGTGPYHYQVNRKNSLFVTATFSGEALFAAMKALLEKSDLSLDNCFGISSNGVNSWLAIITQFSRVFSKKIQTVCFSNALVTSFKSLSKQALTFFRESWDFSQQRSLGGSETQLSGRKVQSFWFFCFSPLLSLYRRDDYKELFHAMDPNGERAGTPMPFMRFCATRWLVCGRFLRNILFN